MANQEDFALWATQKGLDTETIRMVVACAATPEEVKEAFDACEPGPPIDTLDSIRALHDGDELGVAPEKCGFMIVGSCPNGDPIALDIGEDLGSVWYMDHETMHSEPLRSISIRVADNLQQLMTRLVNEDDFPFDYYLAKGFFEKGA